MNWYRFDPVAGVLSLEIHLRPGARRAGIILHGDGYLKIRVAARAVDGQANEALCAFLAERLGIAKTRVRVRRGATSRKKTVEALVADFDECSLAPDCSLDGAA